MSPQGQNPGPTPPPLARTSRWALVMGADSFKVDVNLDHFAKQFNLADPLARCYRVARSPGMLHAQVSYRRCGNPRRMKAKLVRDGSQESSLILPSTHYASKSQKGYGISLFSKTSGLAWSNKWRYILLGVEHFISPVANVRNFVLMYWQGLLVSHAHSLTNEAKSGVCLCFN
jgi:hypothetical protein